MKSFFIISALLNDSSQLGQVKRFNTEKEAIEHAKYVIGLRAKNGNHAIDFHVLKVVAKVGRATPPITVQRMR